MGLPAVEAALLRPAGQRVHGLRDAPRGRLPLSGQLLLRLRHRQADGKLQREVQAELEGQRQRAGIHRQDLHARLHRHPEKRLPGKFHEILYVIVTMDIVTVTHLIFPDSVTISDT